ncbi:transcriptional regulator with XRE-family HTH domain [Rhizobium azooxidifex]|uniref:Transcriptional regulator with XRE-family HTH domain n=1 Tax=Mycoplana azooxidifex TaxID=1636188 RepID=A0A7W6D705_9HYPH|nr:helix-turn-helix transcriptional regulator [Mycoplana azooxidifex]MBB3975390.1 transcriptional regulator with XRE-family HTH domain [Mycoplana azooxidifex]
MIDSTWFYQQLEKDGRSLRAMARAMGLDPSSLSRMLRGERRMTADEQDGIAAYLGVSLLEVAAHRRGERQGFAEEGQEALKTDADRGSASMPEGGRGTVGGRTESEAEPDNFYDRVRGCMKGTVTIPEGVDLTEPTDPEWAKVYDDD